jgi:hypothetical protein
MRLPLNSIVGGEDMGASPIIRQVYREHIARWGEPDDSIVYENDDSPDGPLARIDIFVWLASADRDITWFSTIGMADSPMSGADHRAEMHFGIRCHLDPTTVREVSLFLANLSAVPFQNNTFFDWWHTVRWPAGISLFPSTMGLVFYDGLTLEGWDTITFDGTLVKILNIIPITAEEYRIRDSREPYKHFAKIKLDPHEPR